jgi:hypothetical protein
MQDVLRTIGDNREVGTWVASKHHTRLINVSAYTAGRYPTEDGAARAAQRIIAGFSPLQGRMESEPRVLCLQPDRRLGWTAQVRFVVETVTGPTNK